MDVDAVRHDGGYCEDEITVYARGEAAAKRNDGWGSRRGQVARPPDLHKIIQIKK